ncbi:lipid-A-disaccharide synthase-like uncharacterized protein [Parabacteroides sp. PF5-5]|uniref:lipid-A-disaccharide synthase N-terminal domain-containing protein n=1 Tax=unclassified Parabacteroides TaxID=2649774 RepID=UPI002475C0A4|nr:MULTISPECIES: lipid-A-disaccharide synthase N-terminal domain-containing protein [unclassified Parabacteroides]MDH6304102.1 lipid-A-disaccharide synthase-like uncharacterized protein [Parabacteroides sp. PH5-39]MDH6315198.1 lipid-A-disaccharide synthase-like uncharacterized protein [Parabacteroides sp. PF5-13]MDH6318843.1 lipid-A-disaccharide synthase-like uncharacterized protein [Parabacteroides sp. PH5-13]MDH6322572.1 lipid-A-disaccharide synthase-like uncharacterized protein [Parabacteroi
MEVEHIWYFGLGFLAQGLFSARMLIQWVMSEKSGKVVSPMIYWQLSLLASFLLSVYGWLRGDFAIILGQLFSYYIYVWNINAQDGWKKIYLPVRIIILLTPIVAFGMFAFRLEANIGKLFDGNIPLLWLAFGSLGQIIFSFRFIYQWWYSRSKGESLLPANFWILSLIGSSCIIIYGIFRKDPVLIIGQSVGFFTYSRNLYLANKKQHEDISNR